jgi:hypothetical protein
VLRRLATAWKRLFRHSQWNIGVLDASVSELLAGGIGDCPIHWAHLNRRTSFLADPFAVQRGADLDILCEEFDYRASKGRIAALRYADGRFSSPEHAIERSEHMSYPFLVEDSGDVYCIPETAEANEVALYRALELPRKWTKVATLLPEFPGVDTTVFRHEGRWWLTCTRRGPTEDKELWAWHAPELAGPWTEHVLNPIKSDVRSARPGGAPFVHEGVLHRPAQDCSVTYGGRISVQRVLQLTPTEFEEERAAIVELPASCPFPTGPHTLTIVGGRVLVDGRRDLFSPWALLAFLRILAVDAGERLRRR